MSEKELISRLFIIFFFCYSCLFNSKVYSHKDNIDEINSYTKKKYYFNSEKLSNLFKTILIYYGLCTVHSSECFIKLPISSTSSDYSCAVTSNYLVKCWGENDQGQLGQGNTNFVGNNINEMGDNLTNIDLGNDFFPKSIFLGNDFMCALSRNNSIKCWGENEFGQLGYEDTLNRGDMPNQMGDNLTTVDLGDQFYIKDLSLGSNHACALSLDNRIKCWGNNDFGQLGVGGMVNRGDGQNEMGNNLTSVDLGDNFIPEKIFSGSFHNCAISTNQKIKCWGDNSSGQLGYGDGSFRGDQLSDMGNNLSIVDLGDNFLLRKAALGSAFSCGLSTNLKIKCWGENSQGQLGYGDVELRGDKPNQMGNNLTFVELGNDFNVTDITAGDNHICVMSTNNKIKCWGLNNNGNLGYGDTQNRGDDPYEMGDNLTFVDLGIFNTIKVVSFDNFNCALSMNNTIKCWGDNRDGQLGYGDTNSRGDNINEMGNNLSIIDLGREFICNNSKNLNSSTFMPTKLPSTNPSESSVTTLSPTISKEESHSLSSLAIVFIILGSILGVILLISLCLLCLSRINKSQQRKIGSIVMYQFE